ncbi:PEP-CTERM system TPR-repeat protein PrsT [Azospirillum sp. A1-3]|uniref:XrtA/PEP-CTERM system TPR-repeat protein PrsT n=1 Tax=Azospirillum sp. A1-3 TaxID=185874 RepID=UPI002076D61B|nr:XrtA/PEP-CTERM system TPR-repeat protein PrsT [Azospirillum sp. A1-3]MCM8738533.1 PEP-CTERM system TPR-repeat protein PrsT [Azospirillum sp. A1-3]
MTHNPRPLLGRRAGFGAAIIAPLVVLAATALPALAHAARDAAAETFFVDAGRQVSSGDINAAIIQLRNALQRDPDFAEAREMLGELSLRQGDLATAEKELRRALALRPTERTNLLLGRVLVRLGKLEEALQGVGGEAADPGLRTQRLTVRAQALLGLNRIDEAEPLLSEALALAPDGATYLEAARVDLLRNRREEARRMLEEALRRDAGLADAWLLKGDLLVRAGDLSAGLDALAQGRQAVPKDVRLPLARAMVLIQAGRGGEAEDDVRHAVALAPAHPMTILVQAAQALATGKAEEADRLYTQIEGQMANSPQADMIGGLIKAQRGQPVQAEMLLSRAIAAVPDRQDIQRLVAELRLTIGNHHGAIDLLSSLLDKEPDDAVLRRQLASAYLRAGDYANASAAFRRLAQRPGPLGAEAARALAVLDARSAGEAPLASGPSPLDGLLIADLLSSHQYDQALDKARALTEAAPASAEAFNLLGSVQMGQGDEAAAVVSFTRALELATDFPPAAAGLVRAYGRMGKAGEAEAFLVTRLAADPDLKGTNAEALVRLYTQLMIEQNRRADAIALLERAVAAPGSPALARALPIQLAGQYLAGKRPADAIAVLETLQARHPRDAGVLEAVVRGFADAGRPEQALAAAKAWSALTPTDSRPRLALGRLAAGMMRLAEARTAFGEVLRQDAANLPAARGLIALELKAGQPVEALAVAQRMAAAAPVAAVLLEAEVLGATGKRPQAVAVLTQALARTPDPALELARFALRRGLGELEQGKAELAGWLAGHPGDSAVRAALAEQALAEGDFRTAAVQYERLARQAPDQAAILNNLAWAKFKLNDPAALGIARQALALAPSVVDVIDTAGWIITTSGRLEEGVGLLRRAALAAPNRPEIQYHFAAALALSGKTDEARTLLQAVVSSPAPFAERDEAHVLLTRIGN